MKPLQLSLLALAIAGGSAQAIASEDLGNLFSGGIAVTQTELRENGSKNTHIRPLP